ncbi:MAG: (2Fe-2S)-binding protein [Gammaproteobacteria bacterium]|nr:MAG: (2Fe-2S)-binding protein [Gammaproteobacteria bacterium]
MNHNNSNKQKTVICTCTGTSKEKIEQLIAKGADTIDEISSATGANTGCGSCDILILELLAQENQK